MYKAIERATTDLSIIIETTLDSNEWMEHQIQKKPDM